MRYSTTRLGFGTIVTVGAVAAYYHAQHRNAASTTARFRDTTTAQSFYARSRRPLVHSTGSSGSSDSTDASQKGDSTQWLNFTDRLAAANASVMSTISLGKMLPDWSIGLPDWITRLQKELNMEPGSLADIIWSEAKDPSLTPEITMDATVRLSADLCDEEKEFLTKRKEITRRALARYLGLPEQDVHPDDVPIIAATGSGGGLRAMVAGAGYYQALQDCGLFDCTTYTAGVSGSCWLQSVFLSSIGNRSFSTVIKHLKDRIGIHIAYPPKALELLDTAPTNKYLLRGFVEKLRIGYSPFGLVDLYGLLLSARLFVPRNEILLDERDLKLSSQRRFLDNGESPLPIYTSVRHEIPMQATETPESAESKIEESKRKDWFQWFEATPFEIYCEDMEAGIPTWGLGRKFYNGVNIDREVPEMKLPLLLGIWGSAFCATLSHYYAEIRPFVTSVRMLKTLDDMVLQRKDALVKVHAFDPATVPNFIKGLKGRLPSTCPESLHNSETIQLMDAGMSNNLACYPLMRKGRNVDILIAFDSSADIQESNWIGYAEGYAKQHKIQGWPVAIGWPRSENIDQTEKQLDQAQASTATEAKEKLIEAQNKNGAQKKSTLGPCTIWVGSKETREADEEPPPSKVVEEEWELMKPEAGIVVAYFPLIPHAKVPGVDPDKSAYLSTWNFEWTPEQIDNLVKLASTNFGEGEEQLKRTVRAVYERKRRMRLQREEQQEDAIHDANERTHRISNQFS